MSKNGISMKAHFDRPKALIENQEEDQMNCSH